MPGEVEVYFNVRRRVFSVRENGKVIGHTMRILLEGAHFVVQEGGRQRVLRTGHKHVHAWVRGIPVSWHNLDTSKGLQPLGMWWNKDTCLRQVTYNPRKYDSFVMVDDTTRRVDIANRVLLDIDPSTIEPLPPMTWAWREDGWEDN
jgi:hypothetical protein